MNNDEAKDDKTYDGNNNSSRVFKENEPGFNKDEEDDEISYLPIIPGVRYYSRRYYPKSCTSRLRYYYETFKIYPTPHLRPREWEWDDDSYYSDDSDDSGDSGDKVDLGSRSSTQHAVYNPPNPRTFYATTPDNDVISGPSTVSSEHSTWSKRSLWDKPPILVDELDVFLYDLKRERYKMQTYLDYRQKDRQLLQIRLERKKQEQAQRERELQQQLDEELQQLLGEQEEQRRQQEEYELKHYFRNVHITNTSTDTLTDDPRHCCRCRDKNTQNFALACFKCGHVRCLSCDAGPKYFYDATLWKYSHQLNMASSYIQRAKGFA